MKGEDQDFTTAFEESKKTSPRNEVPPKTINIKRVKNKNFTMHKKNKTENRLPKTLFPLNNRTPLKESNKVFFLKYFIEENMNEKFWK